MERTHFAHVFFVLNYEQYAFSLRKRSKLQRLRQKLQDQASNPHPFLHTASDQKLDGGKAWERDYSISTCTCFLSKTLDLWEAGTILYEVCTNYMYKEEMV